MHRLPTNLNLLNTTARKLLATFCLFAVLNLALVWQALEYPMLYDDLHLIREFSTQEILSSFHHNYDTDGQENAGLRPFMVLYNHARYEMFHENVVAHRLFLVLLFALYITAVCWIARQFGLRWAWSVLAGVLLLGAKYSVNHYVWLTDGIHLFQGLLFCAAAICLIYAVRSRRWWLYAPSAVFTLVGILTREDTLATVPVLVVLGYVYARYTGQLRWLYLISYAACLGAISAAFLVMRATFVPEAQHPALYVSGLFYHALLTPNFMGITSFDLFTQVLILGWGLVVLNVVVSKFLFRAALPWKMPFLWLACAFIACAPGLTTARANLLIFPMTFMALFLCSVFSEIAKSSQRGKLLVTLAVCWAVVGEVYISSVTVESFNPYSSWVINMNSIFIYGGYSKAATIPAERRAGTEKQLAEVGIRSEDDIKTRLPEMIIELTAENRRIPWPANTAFVPYLHGIDQP